MSDNGLGWVQDESTSAWYYYNQDGVNVKDWNRIDGNFYYFNHPGGSMTWDNTIDGFYLENSGKMVNGTGWLQDGLTEDWYYFSDGEPATGWQNLDGEWYYIDNCGRMVTGWFQDENGDWYYLHSDGTMATGWVEDKGKWYFLYNNGSMAHDKTFDGYHVDESGKMVTGTGWVYSDGSWYYLKDDGEVATDWVKDNGWWYYLYPEGSMANTTTVDGYYLDDTGKWITEIVPKDESLIDNSFNQVPDGAAATVNIDEGYVPENLNFTQQAAKVLVDNPIDVLATQSDLTKGAFAAANFEKDENGVYHTSQPICWQYPGGYCDFYDDVFNGATSMNKAKFTFNVGNNEYILWMWKGDYLNLGAGGEVGIYDNKHSVPSLNIKGVNTPAIDNIPGLYEVSDDALYMTLHASINGKTTILDWNPGKPNWWITGWNPEFQNVAQENIVLSGTINFSGHDDLWEAFYDKYNNIDDRLTFNPDIHTVNFVWK